MVKCIICEERNAEGTDFCESICPSCFENKYGPILMKTSQGRYYGGHKAYLVGGLYSKEQRGNMYLTKDHFIFCNAAIRQSKRWRIIIPLSQVQISGWGVQEQARRTRMGFGGISGPVLFTPFSASIGGGVLHQEGKSHQIVLPYIDENGIPQQPRFAAASITGGKVKEWARTIYDRIIEIKKNESSTEYENGDVSKDPLAILKIRLAKGEVTLEEYNKLKAVFE